MRRKSFLQWARDTDVSVTYKSFVRWARAEAPGYRSFLRWAKATNYGEE